jgi:hypothetical protein
MCLLATTTVNAVVVIPSTNPVIAEFDNASGTGVDTFPGVAGEGWAGPWQERAEFVNATATVTSANELHPDDGNYLSISTVNTLDIEGIDISSTYSLSRSYETGMDIDLTQDHTIEFTVRIDELYIDTPYSAMTSYEDRYEISGSNTPDGIFSTNPTSTFSILARGSSSAYTARQWVFADGNQQGGISSYVESGISLVEGGIYDFSVSLDVATRTYDVTVTDGSTTCTIEGLGWRTGADEVGGWLNFDMQSDAYSYHEIRAMSIDNIRISQVPEPCTVVLLAGLTLGLLVWRKK